MAEKKGDKGITDLQAFLTEMRANQDALAKTQKTLGDALLDLQEKHEKDKGNGQAALRLIELTYDTDADHIKELSYITHLMRRPIAVLYTIERIGSKAVRSGKESLLSTYMENFLRLGRSVDGRHLDKGRHLAADQLSQGEKGEGIEDFGDIGRGGER